MNAHKPPMVALLEMLTGGWVAGAIGAAAELGVADRLRDGPKNVQTLARTVGADERSLYRLLRFMASADLLREMEGQVFALTETGELLRSDREGSLHGAAILMASNYSQRHWEHAAFSVRMGKPSFDKVHGMNTWKYLREHPEEMKVFQNGMTSLASIMHPLAVDAYDFPQSGTVVDVGGGHGQMLSVILQRNPGLRGILFDLPEVVGGSKEVFARMGVRDRAETVSGSFFEAVPARSDIYCMAHILHDWDDEHCVKILKTIRRAIGPEGRLLVFDAVLKGPNEPEFGKLLDLQMLLVTSGQERTMEEFRALFEKGGFKLSRVIPTRSSMSIAEGVPV